jgi:hypothetical protein
MFFSELNGHASSGVSSNLQNDLKKYTETIGQRLGQLGSSWNSAH